MFKPLLNEGGGPPPPPDPTATLTSAVSTLVQEVRALRDRGDAEGERRVAESVGWDPAQLSKVVDEAIAAGKGGEGVVQAIQTVGTMMAASQLDRDGKREVASLATHKRLGTAFDTHGSAFRAWLTKSSVPYGRLADPDRAEEMFSYFLANHTTYFDDQRKADVDTAVAAERKRITDEMALRRRAPADPSLPNVEPIRTAPATIRDMLRAKVGASEEPTEPQETLMRSLGFTDEQIKTAMKSQAQKTATGTPLDFVPTHNEGAL